MTHAFDAFGLRILVVNEDVPFDVAVVLGALPSAAPSSSVSAHITLRVRHGAAPLAPVSEASFFHGTVEGRAIEGGYALRTSVAEVRVSSALVDVIVHDEPGDEADVRLGVPVFIGLAIALRHHGRFHLHAAGLADERGSVLVVGQQGAGKTSTCLALVEAGCAFVGDDAVFLAARDDTTVAYGVPKAFHLGDLTQAAFPHLRPLCGDAPAGGAPKRPLDPARVWQGRMRSELLAPFALVLPEITTSTTTTLERVDPAEAFGHLLESSALGIVDGMIALPEQLALLQHIAGDGRAWRLRLGADALARPALVAGLLRRHFASAA